MLYTCILPHCFTLNSFQFVLTLIRFIYIKYSALKWCVHRQVVYHKWANYNPIRYWPISSEFASAIISGFLTWCVRPTTLTARDAMLTFQCWVVFHKKQPILMIAKQVVLSEAFVCPIFISIFKNICNSSLSLQYMNTRLFHLDYCESLN